MALHETGASGVNGTDQASHSADGLSASRALVPLAQSEARMRGASHFRLPTAAFLAHLIAAKQNERQMRQRGRIAPETAASAYATTALIGKA